MNIRQRLLAGFFLIITVVIIVNGVILFYLKQISGLTFKLYRHPYAVSTTAYKIEAYIVKIHRSMKDVALAQNHSQIDEAARIVATYEKDTFRQFDIITERFLGDKQQIAEIRKVFTEWQPIRNQVIRLMKSDKRTEAAEITKGKGAEHVRLLRKKVKELTDFAENKAASFYQEASVFEDNALTVTCWLTGFLAISGIILAFIISKSIIAPLNQTIDGLKNTSGKLASASVRFASSGSSQAEMSSRQAASVEQISSALEETASMSGQNADDAKNAKAKIQKSKQIVGKVEQHIESMTRSMNKITESSKETAGIIKTIDEIAFQTNLLALNAAVEAARAGEAGAGFAVVANEVRALALRSAEAAKNTSSLIENTVRAVQSGHELTELTHEAYRENIAISDDIAQLINEIAASSQDQAQGISQMSKASDEMDSVAQENAAHAEEVASAAEDMETLANHMGQFVKILAKLAGNKEI